MIESIKQKYLAAQPAGLGRGAKQRKMHKIRVKKIEQRTHYFVLADGLRRLRFAPPVAGAAGVAAADGAAAARLSARTMRKLPSELSWVTTPFTSSMISQVSAVSPSLRRSASCSAVRRWPNKPSSAGDLRPSRRSLKRGYSLPPIFSASLSSLRR